MAKLVLFLSRILKVNCIYEYLCWKSNPMKALRIFLFCIISFSVLIACQQVKQEPVLASVEMKVDGMVCAMGCAKYIEDKVADLDGVTKSVVDYESGIASFEFDETQTNSKELEAYIDDIHDGQYQAEIIDSKEKTSEEKNLEMESNQEDEETLSTVRKPFHFSLPDLLGYFLKSLR